MQASGDYKIECAFSFLGIPMESINRLSAALILATSSLGCRSEPAVGPKPLIGPDYSLMTPAVGNKIREARDVSDILMDVPQPPPFWMINDSALVARVRDAKGVVFIGLKAPTSPRVMETVRLLPSRKRPGTLIPMGTRSGISAEEIRAAVAALQRQGVKILKYYATMGTVLAEVDPELSPKLRASVFVDYISPNTPTYPVN
jgi:hypothetical protein